MGELIAEIFKQPRLAMGREARRIEDKYGNFNK
jgi:hypothetical protein